MATMHAVPDRRADGQMDRQTDGRKDEHHGNSATNRSTNASRAKRVKTLNKNVVCKFIRNN